VLNRFYVYIDDLTSSTNDDDLDNAAMNQTTDHGCDPSAYTLSSKGWYIDLKDTGFYGEQTVTSALIAGGAVMFSTNRPKPPATGMCSSSLGEAWGYTLNLKTASGAIGVSGNCGGTRGSPFVGGGLPPSPVIGTVMIGTKAVTVILGAAQKSGGVSTPISPQKVKPSISPVRQRIYWRQSGVD
jgi:type IV pilus assembly protein PilY1